MHLNRIEFIQEYRVFHSWWTVSSVSVKSGKSEDGTKQIRSTRSGWKYHWSVCSLVCGSRTRLRPLAVDPVDGAHFNGLLITWRERERVFSKCFSFLLVIKSDKRLVFFPFFISCVRTGHVNVWIFCSGFLSLWANMVETLESNSQKLFSFKLAFNDRVRERPHSLSPKIINNSKRQCNRVPSIPLLLDW